MIAHTGPEHPAKWLGLKNQAYGQSMLHEQSVTVRNSSNSAVNWVINNWALIDPDPNKLTPGRVGHLSTFKPYDFFD